MKTTYFISKSVYGTEVNQVNPKTYTTEEDAINDGNLWLKDCKIDAEYRIGRSFEVLEKTENGFKFTGIARAN